MESGTGLEVMASRCNSWCWVRCFIKGAENGQVPAPFNNIYKNIIQQHFNLIHSVSLHSHNLKLMTLGPGTATPHTPTQEVTLHVWVLNKAGLSTNVNV